MKNEALETHVVRHVDLLAAKRQPGGRVFLTTDGTFWETDTLVEPSVASAPEGDCLKLLQRIDGQERFSLYSALLISDFWYLFSKPTWFQRSTSNFRWIREDIRAK